MVEVHLAHSDLCYHSLHILSYYDRHAAIADFAVANKEVLGLNDTFISELLDASTRCGYEAAMVQLANYPHTGQITLDDQKLHDLGDLCRTWDRLQAAALEENACFNICMFAQWLSQTSRS